MNKTPEWNRKGWIYYALGATARVQWVKIGFTADLRRRMNSLRREAPGGQMPTLLGLVEEAMRSKRVGVRERRSPAADDRALELVARIRVADAQIASVQAEINDALAIRDSDVRGLIAEHGPAGARDRTGYSASTIRLIRGRPAGEGASS